SAPMTLLDCHDKNLLFWDASMPEELHQHTLAAVTAAMGVREGHMEVFDSEKDGKDSCMEAILLSRYNRMHTPGDDFPEDAYPYMAVRMDPNGTIRTNYSQMAPYGSKEYKENQVLANALIDALRPMLDWLLQTVKLNMAQDELEELEVIIRSLPLSSSSPFHPWTSMIVNFQAVTAGHCDYGDKNFCGIFTLGDFVGGELVLYEPGLVVPLRSGDLAIFPSADTTHFNLHCTGVRMSFVFKSDHQLSRWPRDANGFAHTSFSPFTST
ncbi:hypothetical protein EVG20_g1187, partial [Dentipellis fragilis]